MKRFLSILIAFFVFAFVSPQVISAAEIPDIRSLNENQIKFSRVGEIKGGKGFYYNFDCIDKKGKEYLTQYVNFLTNNFGYTVSKSKKDMCYLVYSGVENISTITDGKTQYHVCVVAGSDWIIVYLANGIEMTTLKDGLAQYGSTNDYELFPIPDIRLLNQAKIKLKDATDLSGSSQSLTFDCSDKNGREYMAQYVNYLTNNLNFTVLKHKEPHGLFAYEDWELVYSGTGNFSPALYKKHEYHVKLSGNKDLIFVDFINGITMVTPASKTPTQPTPAENNPVSTNQNGGADVPDFETIGDEIVYHHNERNRDKSITYVFKASGLSESRADEYLNQYISLLTGSSFVQTGYDKKKFNSKRVQATRQSETWTFSYNGAKSISSLSDGNALHVKRIRNPQTGDTSFEIRVTKDLIFAGNYEMPAPPPPGKTFCSACGGSGKCSTCDGKGYYNVGSDYDQPCGSCLTTGDCSDCNGTGYV